MTVVGNNGKRNSSNGKRKVLAVTTIDFNSTEFTRIRMDPPPRPESRARFLSRVYISPLLRWHASHLDRRDAFRDWIDWDWQEWLGERVWGITDGMREIWGP